MQIEYCEGCRNKLTEVEFKSGQALWINNQAYCKECSEKVPRSNTSASRSGTRTVPGGRGTPSGSRSTPGHSNRRLSTPGSNSPRRSGLTRAAAAETAHGSGAHPRRSSPHGRAVQVSEGPSMVMVSIVGAAIGVLLAVIVIMVFLR